MLRRSDIVSTTTDRQPSFLLRPYFLGEKRMKRSFRSPVRLWDYTREDLAGLCHALGYRTGAEIGVQGGLYSLALCRAMPGLSLLAVDPYDDYGEDEWVIGVERNQAHYAAAQKRLAPYDVTFVVQKSHDAVREIPDKSIDFVYIDGNHLFDFCMRDLIEWSRRVKPGGIVAVHDFFEWDQGGVVEAVMAYTRAHQITDWFVTDEKYPTSFWVNP
jgi:predicted O-methyltransferase YrrM